MFSKFDKNWTRNWVEKLWILVDLERELKDESTESKITLFGSRFAEKSKSKNYLEFLNVKREKTEKIYNQPNLPFEIEG